MNQNERWIKSTLVATAMIFSPLVMAAGDIEAGKAKSAMCVSCHGDKGLNPIPGYPKIGWQDEQYLVTSMKAYRNNERKGALAAIMTGMAGVLTDDDINNLAAYYASIEP